MFRGIARVAAPLLAVSFLVFGSGLAPLHAHESDAPHPHALVHSHFGPHHQAAHDTDEPEIEPGEHVIWLDTAVVHTLPFQLDAPSAVLTRVVDPVVPSSSWSVIAFDDSAPPHGPPRSIASLRAPPAFPV